MAVGPSSYEEAVKVWSEIASKYENLEDLISASEDKYQEDTPLHATTRLMAYSLEDESEANCFLCNKQENHLGEKRIS